MTDMHVICEGAGRRHNQYGCHSGCKTRSLSGVKDDMEADKRFASDCLFWGLKYGDRKIIPE